MTPPDATEPGFDLLVASVKDYAIFLLDPERATVGTSSPASA